MAGFITPGEPSYHDQLVALRASLNSYGDVVQVSKAALANLLEEHEILCRIQEASDTILFPKSEEEEVANAERQLEMAENDLNEFRST